jgi:endonuclease IV
MLGIHVAKQSKVLNAPNKTRKTILDAIRIDTTLLGLNAVQIFTHGPRNRKANNIDYDLVKKYCVDQNIYLVVHSSYMTSGIWNINNSNKNTNSSKLTTQHLSDQLLSCSKIESKGLVVHLPHKTPDSIAETIKIIEPILRKHKIPIILETEAHKPSSMSYESPEKLNVLCQTLNNKHISSKVWGICLDTAHIWASVVDISSKTNVDKWFTKFKYPQKISLIHLNGTSTKLGDNQDIHSIAFSKEDKIWSKYITDYSDPNLNKVRKSGAYAFIKFCKKNNVPVICEINRGSQSMSKFSLNLIEQFLF